MITLEDLICKQWYMVFGISRVHHMIHIINNKDEYYYFS
jgi:hypothetical protein